MSKRTQTNDTTMAYEVEYKILDRTYSVVLTTPAAVQKCINSIAERNRSWVTRHVVLSVETGKIVTRGSKILQDSDY